MNPPYKYNRDNTIVEASELQKEHARQDYHLHFLLLFDIMASLTFYKKYPLEYGSALNVFCYADNILLTSVTVSGLQTFINVSTSYIESSRSCFNLKKGVTLNKKNYRPVSVLPCIGKIFESILIDQMQQFILAIIL